MTAFNVPYGDSLLGFEIPEGEVLFKGEMNELPELADLEGEVVRAVERPIGTAPLSELAAGKKHVLILIEDYTRRTPLDRILPVLVSCLNKYGVPDDCVSFLTAPGTHRLMTEAEIEAKIGPEMARRFRVTQHDASDLSSMRDLGAVRVGGLEIPVLVNAMAAEADLLIGLGSIVPHPDAGFSGGAKIVQPGICGHATTAATHLAAALLPVIPLGDANTPARAGMESVAATVGLSFILNAVPNASGGVTALVAGDFVKAHRAGAEIARRIYRVGIPRRADIVVAASYPCDADFWQASKGLVAGSFAVREGGILIFVSPCREGLADAHPELERWLSLSVAEASALARSQSASIGAGDLDFVSADVALNNARIRERCAVFTVSGGLSPRETAQLGHEKFASVQDALDEARRRLPGASLGIIPRAGVSLPEIA